LHDLGELELSKARQDLAPKRFRVSARVGVLTLPAFEFGASRGYRTTTPAPSLFVLAGLC
jgi:hypothetical protein